MRATYVQIHASQENFEVGIALADNGKWLLQACLESHLCKIYADKINQSPASLHKYDHPWSFLMWDIDAIGIIHLKASNGHIFILVDTNYFAKWVEATLFSNMMKHR